MLLKHSGLHGRMLLTPLLCCPVTFALLSVSLQVRPPLEHHGQADRATSQLSGHIMHTLNLSNNAAALRFLQLHPAVGVPLLEEFLQSGLADEYGQPVYLSQLSEERVLDLPEFLVFEHDHPDFVGR